MKKEEQKIATNTSSGAEKVERIQKEIKTEKGKATQRASKTVTQPSKKEKTAKGDAALGDSANRPINVKQCNAQSTDGKAEAESAAAKARVQAALKKKEDKEQRKAEKTEKLQKKKEERQKRAAEFKEKMAKRAAEKKALVEKRAAERKARIEKKKAEKEAKIRERAHQKANKKQANSKKKTQKHTRQKKSKNKESREHRDNKGYGGWIAAVIALGVTTLALATTVTVGAVEMNAANDAAMNAYRGTMYELTGILERVESDLDRARISDSVPQQSRVLTDLLVQARLAELDIEKLPVDVEADRNVTIFVNHTAGQCERMLSKLRHGESLSQEDRAIIERLYQANHSVREELNNLVTNMTDKDLMKFVKKGEGAVSDSLKKLEKMTLEENRAVFEKMPEPREKKGEEGNKEQSRIEGARAEELCAQYFQGYNVKEYQCIGETVTADYAAYNVQGHDDKGTVLFAEIDQTKGTLIRFDYYEECAGEKFDLKNAERIAEEYLEKLGYDDMEVVRCRQNGSTTDFTFVYEEDDVLYYPDEIHVKVCRTRGIVSGMDAGKYLKNHRGRYEVNVKINLAEAYDKLYEGLSVEASRLTVIQTARGERTAYEMLCSYGEERYLVYLDAMTGEEISIINVNDIQ